MSAWQLQQAVYALKSGVHRLTESDDDLLVDALETLTEETAAVREAIVGVARKAREAEALADMAKRMARDTAERQKRFEARAEQLRGLVFAALDALGEKKIEAADLTISLRAGQPAVIVTDETKIPDQYWRTERKISLSAIKDDLKQGVVVDGAEMANALPSLMLKAT